MKHLEVLPKKYELNYAMGDEVFIPKVPSMKVTDLADTIAPEAKKEIIGIRPGEKINEILLVEEDLFRMASDLQVILIVGG